MKNKNKKASNNLTDQSRVIESKDSGTRKMSTYLYSNQNSNINTHFFDKGFENISEQLRTTANSIDFGASHIRVADKIAKQLGIPVRDFLRHVEILRGKYNIPIIGANHKPQGFFIATFAEEGESYLKQQKAREEHGAKARHGVERGLTNDFLNKVNQWRHNHA